MDVVAETTIQAVEEASDAEKAKQLPEPSGYHILIGIPESEEKTDGGILKARQTTEIEETATIVGFVLKLGPDCYQDKKRFPSGPWCKEGDWVCIGRYAGSRFKLEDGEVRIINDDEVIATIIDPEDIKI